MILQILQSQAFITVVAGVLVFAISQWITYTVINPHQEYLKAASELSREMLKLTHKYTNFHLAEEEERTIKDANAAYLAAAWNSGWWGRRKRRKNAFLVAQSVNGIASLGHSAMNDGAKLLELHDDMSKIEKLDKNLKIQFVEEFN